MHQIEPGIYCEESYSGVTLGAIVLPHGTIFIDAPLSSEDARSWRASLLTMGGSTNRILVDLDSNLDRTLGSRALDCTIVAHQKTAQVFRNRPSIFKSQSLESGADWETSDEVVGTRWAPPDITFSDRMNFHWGEKQVILEHHPGPTIGAIWVIIPESHVLFLGDAVLPQQPPFLAHADFPAWIDNLNLLIKSYRDFTIISGRGGPVSLDIVRTQLRLIKMISSGLERLAKRNAPPEKTESLIPRLLKDLSPPSKLRENYAQRLRYGLFQYYSRRYRLPEDDEEEKS
jgi:glyoxylase-like metal-dependent hydrolase (beta-lactamase superfamily II)